MLTRETQGEVDGFERHFQLQNDDVGTEKHTGSGLDIGGRKAVISAFDDQNPVLARTIDKNRRDAAGYSRRDEHAAGIDTQGRKVLDACRSKEVVAETGDHRNFRSAEARRNRLVRAFAAEAEMKAVAEDGLSRARKLICKGRKVHVCAAYDGDLWWSAHLLFLFRKSGNIVCRRYTKDYAAAL